MNTIDTTSDRPLRADARRNRERVVDAARVAFAEHGAETQMDDVAARAGVGVGTVYRHFPTKEGLMGEIVRQQFDVFLANAKAGLADDDGEPFAVLAGVLLRNAETLADDAATRHVMMTASGDQVWAAAAPAHDELLEITGRLIARAQAAGTLRADFTKWDIPMLMCGLGATMGRSEPECDWRRHLDLLLDAMRPR